MPPEKPHCARVRVPNDNKQAKLWLPSTHDVVYYHEIILFFFAVFDVKLKK